MFIRQNTVLVLFNAIKEYFKEIKIDGETIPIYSNFESPEAFENKYPFLYVSQISIAEDKERRVGQDRYNYGEDLKKKINAKPFLLQFNLDVLAKNPNMFFPILELVNRELISSPHIELNYKFNDEIYNDSCRIIVASEGNNPKSAVLHNYFVINVEIFVDTSLALEEYQEVNIQIKEGGVE